MGGEILCGCCEQVDVDLEEALRVGSGWSLIDHVGSSIMRKNMPQRVAKCGSGHLQLPTLLQMQIFKRGRRMPLRFRPQDGL